MITNKIYQYVCLVLIGISFLLFLCGGKVDASWEEISCDKSCAVLSGVACKDVSNGYTVPYCYTKDCDYVSKCMWSLSVNELSRYRRDNANIEQESAFLQHYCKTFLSSGQDQGRIYYSSPSVVKPGDWDWQQTFDSRQSLFVYALCSSFEDDDLNRPFLGGVNDLDGVFKGNVAKLLKLQQRSSGKDLCSLKDDKSLSDCDMSIYATQIFSAIMSEAFKIKYAEVFHVDSVNNFAKKEDRITSFLLGYFNMKDSYKVLQGWFPQTVDVINSNQQYHKRMLDKLKLIDNEMLVARASKTKCLDTKNMTGLDFIACAMHGSHGTGLALDPAFVTWFYNELLNYNLFVEDHQNWLEELIKDMVSKAENEKTIRVLESKLLDFQVYANMQEYAAKETLHNLEELNMTYPLHIGLLLYQEKVKRFRDNTLSPIITLFYSLSEKLQNVQFPE